MTPRDVIAAQFCAFSSKPHTRADAALAALSAAGFAVVPKEATGKMVDAGHNARWSLDNTTCSVWRAMVAAAEREARDAG